MSCFYYGTYGDLFVFYIVYTLLAAFLARQSAISFPRIPTWALAQVKWIVHFLDSSSLITFLISLINPSSYMLTTVLLCGDWRKSCADESSVRQLGNVLKFNLTDFLTNCGRCRCRPSRRSGRTHITLYVTDF